MSRVNVWTPQQDKLVLKLREQKYSTNRIYREYGQLLGMRSAKAIESRVYLLEHPERRMSNQSKAKESIEPIVASNTDVKATQEDKESDVKLQELIDAVNVMITRQNQTNEFLQTIIAGMNGQQTMMIKAIAESKELLVNINSNTFKDSKSTAYIGTVVRQMQEVLK